MTSDDPITGFRAQMTLEQASDLVGDDIDYWLNNPFMDRDAIASKVCWWIQRAVEATS